MPKEKVVVMDILINRRRFKRQAARTVAFALVLVLAATSVGAFTWHQHADEAAARTCQVCHFAQLRVVAPHAQAQLLQPRLLYRVRLRDSVWTYAGPAAFSVSSHAPPL